MGALHLQAVSVPPVCEQVVQSFATHFRIVNEKRTIRPARFAQISRARVKASRNVSQLALNQPGHSSTSSNTRLICRIMASARRVSADRAPCFRALRFPCGAPLPFLPRCLICHPVSTIGTRLHREAIVDPAPLHAFAKRLGNILTTGMGMDPETRELRPRTLPLSEEALALLIGFSDEVERAQAPGGKFELVRGFASKAAEQAARIAAVLSLWRDMGVAEVSIDAMRCGIRLAQFYLSEALRLSGAAQVSEEVAQAESLRVWMLSPSHGKDWLVVRDVVQRGPNRLRDRPKITRAIAMLVDAGWLAPLDAGTVLDGRTRKQAWRVIQ